MAASKEGLIDNINCKLTTGGLTDIQASQLAGAAQALCCSSFYAVPCAACLPNAALNKGRFIYVQNIERYRYSDGTNWTNEFCSAKIATNLFTWGANLNGALGTGDTVSRSSPGTVAGGGVTWCAVSVATCTAAAIKTDGTLWTWGLNTSGQLGDGTTTARSSPGTVAGGGTTWCTVSVFNGQMAAIKTDGTLWTWGFNQWGQLGDGTTTSRSSPGTVAGGGTTWRSICFNSAAIAIKTDGTLWTWGKNDFGQLGTGNTTSRSSPGTVAGGGSTWCAASMGAGQTAMAIKTDGTLWTWGYNGQGQLGTGDTTSRSSPGTTAGCGTTWSSVSNEFTSMAIKSDGTLWTWGRNVCGPLGDGTVTNRCSPGTTIGGGTNWCFIHASQDHGLGVKTDGTLWTWGRNHCGQLGDNTITDRCSPGTTIGGGIRWTKGALDAGNAIALQNPAGF